MSDRAVRYLGILLFGVVAFVLAGILIPAGRVVEKNIKHEARSVEGSIVTALKAYRTDYGHFPAVRVDGRYETAEDNAKLMRALRGLDATDNTRKIVYIENRTVKQLDHPRSGFDAKGTLWDTWGNFYRIRVDADGDGIVENPYKDTRWPTFMTDVIVWSLGKDGIQGSASARDVLNDESDDVVSWQ